LLNAESGRLCKYEEVPTAFQPELAPRVGHQVFKGKEQMKNPGFPSITITVEVIVKYQTFLTTSLFLV